MTPIPVLVLHEAEYFRRPPASTFIRLIRPLTHPTVAAELAPRFTTFLRPGLERFRAVVIDRLGPPEMTRASAEGLLERVHAAGGRLIYSLDENFLAGEGGPGGWDNEPGDRMGEPDNWTGKPGGQPTAEKRELCLYLLGAADRVVVPTQELASDLAGRRAAVDCIRSDLDERLLAAAPFPPPADPFTEDGADRPLVIGYMGPLADGNSDGDMVAMMLPAMAEVARRFGPRVRFQRLGRFRERSRTVLDDILVNVLTPFGDEDEYPHFMLWWTSHIRWDIALAPSHNTPLAHAQSDMHHLSCAAIGAAGVYSRVPPDSATVRDGETGLEVANSTEAWVDAISRLVEDAELRARLASAAHAYLWRERVLARGGARAWLEILGS